MQFTLDCISSIEFYRAARFPRVDVNGYERAREREKGKKRDATTGLFSWRNIAPASECVRNRADCDSVEMDGKKEKKEKSRVAAGWN